MSNRRRVGWSGLLCLVACSLCGLPAWSQPPAGGGTNPAQAADDDERVSVQREAVRLIDPKRYQVPLPLEPVRKIVLTAPVGGRIKSVLNKPGDKVPSGTPTVRLEETEQALLLEQAQANFKVAEIEVRRAMKQTDSDLVELAEARRDAAKAALELAQYHLEQTSVRVPFEGEVFRVHVIEGQVVRAGDPLFDFGDPAQLRVEIPVDSKTVKTGQNIKLAIEEETIDGKVENLLPLDEKFGPLRELAQSLASATVVIENKSGRLRPGQLVDVPLIPRQFVTQIPNRSLSNVTDGGRKVQVYRAGFVRDVGVQLLGLAGTDLSYVSGSFAEGDELIVSASKPLKDGQPLRPVGTAAASTTPASAGGDAGGDPSKTPPRRAGF